MNARDTMHTIACQAMNPTRNVFDSIRLLAHFGSPIQTQLQTSKILSYEEHHRRKEVECHIKKDMVKIELEVGKRRVEDASR